MARKLSFVVHNVRSAHNVGSILRSADAFNVDKVYLTGYTPYPKVDGDSRLPHLAEKIHKQIVKTALGAESTVAIEQQNDIFVLINALKADDFKIIALEQDLKSVSIDKAEFGSKVAVIVGREVEGVEVEVLDKVDEIIEIPMEGTKESLNVAVAAAIMMYVLRSLK